MSILHTHSAGWVISHEKLVNEIYTNVLKEDKIVNLNIKNELFDINSPYRKIKDEEKLNRKRKINLTNNTSEVLKKIIVHVKESFAHIVNDWITLNPLAVKKIAEDNTQALKTSASVYEETGKYLISEAKGSNLHSARIQQINNSSYLFPEDCTFYAKNVSEIAQTLENNKFDLVLLDPPWWNKYIRRIKKAKSHNSYEMMYNKDLEDIPIEKLLISGGLVVVWCTNSPQHLTALEKEIFPKWGLKKLATWYWVKMTKSGETVLPFNEPLGKQPFEQIIFASAGNMTIPDKKLILSVPSAIHSNKPPLIELLKPYLPSNPKCLEIFARYLLPHWTSYGLEVLRFQHMCCFEDV